MPGKQDDLTLLQKRKLIKEYGIEFKGPRTPSQWPKSHSELFLRIRETGRTEFDKHLPDRTTNNDPIGRKMKDRAAELVRAAIGERKLLVNEATLRMNTEHLVFARFATGVKCKTCSNYLWVSEFSALPSNQVEADKLERRRAERLLCRCPAGTPSWTPDSDDDPGETFLFKNCDSALVEYDPSEGLEKRGLPRRKPDRLFGLASTKSIEYYLKAEPVKRMRHSPFSNLDILYPFLIVEAKPEGNGPGFAAIERQTAFPIRTLLKLQEDLQQNSGVPLSPFLWFLSCQGDEWRVAACVTCEGKYQVFDLWMGRATSRDGALQLLLIIDVICEWARDVFRFEILCCLAGGRDNLRKENVRRENVRRENLRGENLRVRLPSSAPTYGSRFSTQEPQLERPTSSQDDADTRAGVGSDLSSDVIDLTHTPATDDLALEDTVMEDHPALVADDGDSVEPHPSLSSNPLMKWANMSPVQAPWIKDGTIRHANMCLFVFAHLALPSEFQELAHCLDKVSSLKGGSVRGIARSLALCFRDDTGAMATTTNRILQLKDEWLRRRSEVATGSEAPVQALFGFRTFVRTSDWQIVRELRCVSCTPDGLHALTTIAQLDPGRVASLTQRSTDVLLFTTLCFRWLHSLAEHDAATAAINSTKLHLVVKGKGSGQPHCQWVADTAPVSMINSFEWLSEIISSCLTPTVALDQDSTLMEVLEKPLPDSLRAVLGPPLSANSGAILLYKGRHWPVATPSWCLMVLEEVDFQNNQEVGKSLTQTRKEGFCYTFAFSSSRDNPGAPTRKPIDEHLYSSFLNSWLKALSS